MSTTRSDQTDYDAEGRRVAIMRMGGWFLARILDLPKGTTVVKIQERVNAVDTLELIVESPTLPLVKPGRVIPHVTPVYRKLKNGRMRFESWFSDIFGPKQ